MGKPVVHWEINTTNKKGLSRFYTQLFDWSVEELDGDYSFVDTESEDGIDGGFAQVEKDDPKGLIVYVEVPDIEAALAKAEKLGGRIIVPPTEMPEGTTLAVFADPEGNHVGLLQD